MATNRRLIEKRLVTFLFTLLLGTHPVLATADEPAKPQLGFDELIRAADEAILVSPNSAQARYERGKLRAGRKDWDQALADLNKALRLDPKHVAALAERGGVWSQKGEFEKARQDFNDAVDVDPLSMHALSQRAQFSLARDELDKALDDYNRLIGMNSENAEALVGRGRVWFAKQDARSAFADFDEAIRLDPKSPNAFHYRGRAHLRLDQLDEALSDLTRAIELDPQDAVVCHERGNLWIIRKEYSKAIDDFSAAIFINPNYALAYQNRAFVRATISDWDQAIADNSEAIRLAPDSMVALRNRGVLYHSLGKTNEALEDLGQVIRLKPDSAAGYLDRSRVFHDSGDPLRAIADAGHAIRIEPSSPRVYRWRGFLQQYYDHADEAVADFTALLELDPTNTYALGVRARLLAKRDDVENAIADNSEIIRLEPANTDARARRARLWTRMLDFDKAIDDWTFVIERVPTADAHVERGNVQKAKGTLEQACADYAAALQIDPKSTDALASRGEARLQQRDLDGALADFTATLTAAGSVDEGLHTRLARNIAEVLKEFPDSGPAYRFRGRLNANVHQYNEAMADYSRAIRLDPNDADSLLLDADLRFFFRQFDLAVEEYSQALQINPQLLMAVRHRGAIYKQQGQFDLALADVNESIRLEPSDADGYGMRAAILRSMGKVDLAMQDYTRLIETNPKRYGFAWVERGRIWLEQREPDRALADFNEAFRLAPWYQEIHMHRARAWIARGDVAQALAELEEVPIRFTTPFGSGDSRIALLEFHDEIIRLFPASAGARLSRGKLRNTILEGRHWPIPRSQPSAGTAPPDAVSDSLPVPREYPPPLPAATEVVQWVATARMPSGNKVDAKSADQQQRLAELFAIKPEHVLADLDEAIRIDPGLIEGYVRRAEFCEEQGDAGQALADYSSAIAHGCREYFVFASRAKLWRARGERNLALADYNEALQVRMADDKDWFRVHPKPFSNTDLWTYTPADGNAPLMTADDLWCVRRSVPLSNYDNWRFSELTGTRALYHQRFRVSADLYFNRAEIWEELDELDRALADYREALRLDPKSKWALNNTAWIYATAADSQFRDGKRAVELAEACVNLEIEHWYWRGTLAAAYAEVGNFSSAIEVQSRALTVMAEHKVGRAEMEAAVARLALYVAGKPYRRPSLSE